jgi:hypothetical protein
VNILIPWETAAKRRRKQDRDEVLDCVGRYAKIRMAELITVGEDEVPDDFFGFVFLSFKSKKKLFDTFADTSSRQLGLVPNLRTRMRIPPTTTL